MTGNITSVGDGNTAVFGDDNNIVFDSPETKINEPIEEKYIKDKKLPQWVYWVWFISIVSLGLSIASIIVSVHPHMNWNLEIVSAAIVLGFVGILATFIVVSNYAQLKRTEDKVSELRSYIDKIIDHVEDIEQNAIIALCAAFASDDGKHDKFAEKLYKSLLEKSKKWKKIIR